MNAATAEANRGSRAPGQVLRPHTEFPAGGFPGCRDGSRPSTSRTPVLAWSAQGSVSIWRPLLRCGKWA